MDNAIAHCCVLVMFACGVGAEVPSVMYLFLQGGAKNAILSSCGSCIVVQTVQPYTI